jgi:hypothetical protein
MKIQFLIKYYDGFVGSLNLLLFNNKNEIKKTLKDEK